MVRFRRLILQLDEEKSGARQDFHPRSAAAAVGPGEVATPGRGDPARIAGGALRHLRQSRLPVRARAAPRTDLIFDRYSGDRPNRMSHTRTIGCATQKLELRLPGAAPSSPRTVVEMAASQGDDG